MSETMTMAEFIELTKTRGSWAVYVKASGYGLCRCGFPHGTPHHELHSRGLNVRHASLIAEKWARTEPVVVDEKPCGCCSNGCACAEHTTASIARVKNECGLPHGKER